MRYLSLFTGVGGFDVGFDRAGMTCVAQVEQDKHCLKVLEHHWPNVPKIKDVRDVKSTFTAIDLVCGGFPCQDVSVAGNRAGLAGDRSGLWFEFLRILQCVKPNWVVIENVPGLLSSNAGRDFATILHGLGQCGYQSAWRILDSQYWGVAQRRRRLYLVGCLTDGRAAEVLFEREGGYWNTPSRSETGQGAPSLVGTLTSSNSGKSSPGNASETDVIVPTFCIKGAAIGRKPEAVPQYGEVSEDTSYTLNISEVHAVSTYREQAHGRYAPDVKASPVKARDGKSATDLIAYDIQQITSLANRSNPQPGDPVFTLSPQHQGVITGLNWRAAATAGVSISDNQSPTLRGARDNGAVHYAQGVRRLTPLECERLQGFPDGWTDVDGMSDAQRYRQMGNAVTVNVTEWIGKRIMEAIP